MKNDIDQLPPHCVDSERGILGCALEDPLLATEIREEWFYVSSHHAAAVVMILLNEANQPLNRQTVIQRLNQDGIPDAPQLVDQFDAACPSPSNFSYWRDVLCEKLMLRKMLKSAAEVTLAIYGQKQKRPAEILNDYERRVLAIGNNSEDGSGEADKRAILLELILDYDRALKGEVSGNIRTGYSDLDRILGGLKPQQLAIIAARPSVGKTALALNIAERVAFDAGQSVGFFSLEMSRKQLFHRLACSISRTDSTRLNDGKITEGEIKAIAKAAAQIDRSPLYICDQGGVSLGQLTTLARRMVQRHGIKLLIIDYLGLLRSGEKNRSRYEETTLISNGIKTLAKELNLPVILLAQLNRDHDKENRPPRMSDLRDSGAIEQDADIIGLLHRDDNQTGEIMDVKLIVAKHRTGRTGTVSLLFHRNYTRFENKNNPPTFNHH